LPTPRRALILASALILSAAAAPPRIGRPRPVPPGAPVPTVTLPPADFDNKLAVGGDELKARKVDTRLNVDVLVNGRGPYRFVVDSGADTSVIGTRIARDLQLPLGTPAVLNGMTSRNLVDRVKVAQLTLGPSTLTDLELPALREADVGSDGLIGIDALVHQRLMMDFEKKLITVEDARTPYRYEANEIVIIAKREHGQLILTHVRASGLPLDAVIDTGTEITIGNLALRDKLIRRHPDRFKTVPVIDVTGTTVNLQLAWIDELTLGPITLRGVPIAFADVPPFKLFGLANEPSLLLGTDILENFRRVSLDFRARKVRFQLRHCDMGVVISTAPENITRITSAAGLDVCSR
jgi:predicted aspartyl protease